LPLKALKVFRRAGSGFGELRLKSKFPILRTGLRSNCERFAIDSQQPEPHHRDPPLRQTRDLHRLGAAFLFDRRKEFRATTKQRKLARNTSQKVVMASKRYFRATFDRLKVMLTRLGTQKCTMISNKRLTRIICDG
jgi:hypothetical protein